MIRENHIRIYNATPSPLQLHIPNNDDAKKRT